MGGGHRHVAPSSAPAVRGSRLLTALVVLLVLSTLAGLWLLRPTQAAQVDVPDGGERVRGTVVAAATAPCSGPSPEAPEGAPRELCVELDVRIDEGPDAGRTVQQTGGDNATGRLAPGDGVVLAADPAATGVQDRYQLTDSQRGRSLLRPDGAVRGRRGGARPAARAAGAARPGAELGRAGRLAGAGAAVGPAAGPDGDGGGQRGDAVGPAARARSQRPDRHGRRRHRRQPAAHARARGGLRRAQLADRADVEDATFVQAVFGDLDVRGLLLAGIVIGAVGILDDVTVTQVSAVHELRQADPAMPVRELYRAGLRVGRDHVAALVNTLLLAYAGASLPLLVIFTTSDQGLVGTLTNGVLAEEVVRTLVGSIGLVAAVPITTALAAVTCSRVEGREVRPGA
jgi:hypothetical protein